MPFFATIVDTAVLQSQISSLPAFESKRAEGDWLVSKPKTHSAVYRTANASEIVLSNGLIARTFRLGPNAATVGLVNLTTGESLLRAVGPEASVTIGGKEWSIGGLVGQPDRAFLLAPWIDKLASDPNAFRFTGFEVGKPRERMPWKRVRHAPEAAWPPPGVGLTLWFAGPVDGVKVGVHYEMADGMPSYSKWLTVENGSKAPIRLDSFSSEILSTVEAESMVDDSQEWQRPNMTVLTDYSFGGMAATNSNRTVYWQPEPEYGTQVNYSLKTPCKLVVKPPLGPAADISPGGSLSSFTSFVLLHDSTEKERRGLALRKMYRTYAPWSLENPIMLHLTSTDPKVVHQAIDQAAECGFEMIVISFWSGLDMEDITPANIAKIKAFREYANSKGIELGGYSLLASRKIDDKNDVIDPKTMKPDTAAIFGSSPCLGSKWGIEYFEKIKRFVEETGFNLLEHDGSYPGDVCASTEHPGHRGLDDSQWNQYQSISALYRWCREKGVFLNVPDSYFFAGSNKTGMGYRESNWSLPREQQHIHARQNLFDGTWEKTPSMGWMMVPMVEYQGGGPAATIEPLHEHLMDYELHLANNFGYGAQACYRGPRLYDAPETKAAVIKWVNWFKKHRDILESDVIHVRRADGRRLDAVLHVNPSLSEKAMLVVYNPSDHEMEDEFDVPLYYSGLTDKVRVVEHDGKSSEVHLDRGHNVKIHVKVAPKTCSWLAFSK